MKTLAIRLQDETAELLTIVAQLEGSSVIDQIREAIEAHLALKAAEGDLAEKALAALEEIDREASARKEAIGSLINKQPTSESPTPPTPITRGRSRKEPSGPEAQLSEPLPFGFQPPSRPHEGDGR